MTAKGSGRLRCEERLRFADDGIGVPVPETGVRDEAARNDAKAIVAVRPSERPGGNPVHAAHVTGE